MPFDPVSMWPMFLGQSPSELWDGSRGKGLQSAPSLRMAALLIPTKISFGLSMSDPESRESICFPYKQSWLARAEQVIHPSVGI